MIQYLKEETFAINRVIKDSWEILKSRYFSILGLFITSACVSIVSAVASLYLSDINYFLSVFFILFFVFLHVGLFLTLNKFILNVMNQQDEARIFSSIPTKSEFVRVFFGGFILMGLAMLVFGLLAVLAWPLIYIVGVDSIIQNIVIRLFPFITLFFYIRVIFYPLFILDKGSKIWESIKYSIALTKNNVVKLFILIAIFILLNILMVSADHFNYFFLTLAIGFVNFLIVIPLSVIVMTVAYRNMVNNQDNYTEIKNI